MVDTRDATRKVFGRLGLWFVGCCGAIGCVVCDMMLRCSGFAFDWAVLMFGDRSNTGSDLLSLRASLLCVYVLVRAAAARKEERVCLFWLEVGSELADVYLGG